VDDDSKEKKPAQAKTAFIIRNTPVWLDQSQPWISDGARKLYKTLRTLADAKNGRLFIPDRGWIRISTIEQKAGMSHNTRVKYMRELKTLGGVSEHRDYVTRSIRGRNRKVLGQAQITVLALYAPNQHKRVASTTDQSGEKANPEPHHKVPTTDQSTTDQSENGLLQTNSSAALKVVSQKMSENTSLGGGGLEGSPLPSTHKERSDGPGVVLDSPQAKPAAAKPAAVRSQTKNSDSVLVDEPTIDSYEAIRLVRHAKSHGWSKPTLRRYLLEFFNADSSMRLTQTEYRAALQRTQYPPQQSGKGKPSNEAMH